MINISYFYIFILILIIISYCALYFQGEARYWHLKYKELRTRLDAMEDMRHMKWHRYQETYENRSRNYGCNRDAIPKGK